MRTSARGGFPDPGASNKRAEFERRTARVVESVGLLHSGDVTRSPDRSRISSTASSRRLRTHCVDGRRDSRRATSLDLKGLPRRRPGNPPPPRRSDSSASSPSALESSQNTMQWRMTLRGASGCSLPGVRVGEFPPQSGAATIGRQSHSPSKDAARCRRSRFLLRTEAPPGVRP